MTAQSKADELCSLKEYIETQQIVAERDDFDEIMSITKSRIETSDVKDEIKNVALRLYDLLKDNYFLFLIINAKLSEIGKGILLAHESNNATVHIALARSFLEHTANLSYHNKLIKSCSKEITKVSTEKEMAAVFDRHIHKLRELFYGSTSDANSKFIHVNDMISILAKIVPSIKEDYVNLCDFVHPNYGSNKLVSSGVLGSGRLKASNDLIKYEIQSANKIISNCIDAINSIIKSTTKSLLEIGMRLNFAVKCPAKVTQIFNDKRDYTGRGRSKDDPLYFHNARTHLEAMSAFYDYVSKHKLKVHKTQIVSVDNEFMLELALTDRGGLWVKYKVRDADNI